MVPSSSFKVGESCWTKPLLVNFFLQQFDNPTDSAALSFFGRRARNRCHTAHTIAVFVGVLDLGSFRVFHIQSASRPNVLFHVNEIASKSGGVEDATNGAFRASLGAPGLTTRNNVCY